MAKKITKKKVTKAVTKAVPVRSTSRVVRFAAVLLPAGMLVLAFTFAASIWWSSPLVASAAGFDFDHIVDTILYNQCHNHLDDNHGHGIDMLDSACASVENASPEALDQHLVTDMNIATTTVLTGTDIDAAGGFHSDLLYFSVSNLPEHGTLTCADGECDIDEVFGSTLSGGIVPNITYTPNANFSGNDEFDFTVSDGKLENDATIYITVNDTTPEPINCETPQVLNEDETACVDPAPVDPNCETPQILENHECVTPEPEPAPETPAPTSNPGGGGCGSSCGGGGGPMTGPFSIGYVNTNPQGNGGGSVLGTSTVATDDDLPAGCNAYLGGYLKKGAKNNSDEVKKLQKFLNGHIGVGIEVTGIFDEATFDAVEKFQLVQWEKVLKPWVAFGLASDHTPTGYVYKTTRHTINLMVCATLPEPAPQLP